MALKSKNDLFFIIWNNMIVFECFLCERGLMSVDFCHSWGIIASKFKDKTTRQCRRRLVCIYFDGDRRLFPSILYDFS